VYTGVTMQLMAILLINLSKIVSWRVFEKDTILING